MNYGISAKRYYNPSVTLWKGVWAYLASIGVVGATDVAAVGIPATWEEFAAKWPALLVALLPAVWRVVENYRKNGGGGRAPMWEWRDVPRKIWPLCLLIGVCACFSGCLTAGANA